MHNKLHITRYNKTRNWAIWANEELLAVTVYRKGAQAVLDYIHTLTQNTINTMSKTMTTAAATPATNNNADFDRPSSRPSTARVRPSASSSTRWA